MTPESTSNVFIGVKLIVATFPSEIASSSELVVIVASTISPPVISNVS
jgi:hypothetical protein